MPAEAKASRLTSGKTLSPSEPRDQGGQRRRLGLRRARGPSRLLCRRKSRCLLWRRIVYRELRSVTDSLSLAGVGVRSVGGIVGEYPALVRVAVGPILHAGCNGHALEQQLGHRKVALCRSLARARPIGAFIGPADPGASVVPSDLGFCPSLGELIDGWIGNGRVEQVQGQRGTVNGGPQLMVDPTGSGWRRRRRYSGTSRQCVCADY